MGNSTAGKWLSVPEAAEIMGCTESWVIRLVKAGQLEGFRLNGRAWAVLRSDAEKNAREYLKDGSTRRPRSRLVG